MSDPTQAGAPEPGLPAPEPGLPAPTPDMLSPLELVQKINSGTQKYGPSHPQHAEARALIQQLRTTLAQKMALLNHADSLTAQTPGPTSSKLMGLAEGASAGLATPVAHGLSQLGLGNAVGDPQLFAQAARQQFPGSFLGGSAVGGGGLSTILSALGVPPNVAMGGTAGLQEGFETGSPTKGVEAGAVAALAPKVLNPVTRALGINALAGKAVGALANQFGGKMAPGLMSKGAAKAAAAIGVTVGDEGEMLMGKPVSEIRAALMKQTAKGDIGGLSQADRVESQIETLRQQATRNASGGVTLKSRTGEPLSTKPILPELRANADPLDQPTYQRRAIAPADVTVDDVRAHLNDARTRFQARGYAPEQPGAGELPQPSGGATLTPQGKGPAGPPAAPPSLFAAAHQQSATILELEDRLGRGLTDAERAKLAAQAQKLQESIGRSRVLRKAGFSSADAGEMAQQGTAVPKEALERATGKRLPGTQKWQ